MKLGVCQGGEVEGSEGVGGGPVREGQGMSWVGRGMRERCGRGPECCCEGVGAESFQGLADGGWVMGGAGGGGGWGYNNAYIEWGLKFCICDVSSSLR